jgi:hypothetical protein
VEFAVAASLRGYARFTVDLLLGFVFDLVAHEGGDFAQVEVGEQHRDDDLRGTKAADAAAAGRFDV